MKRFVILALSIVIVFSFTGCVNIRRAVNSGSVSATQSNTNTSNADALNSDNGEAVSETSVTEEVTYEITYNNIMLYKDSLGTVWMQGIVEVTNTGNTNLYMSSGQFDLEDENGKLIDTKDYVNVYPQVIAPGEKAYYYEETTLDGIDENASVKIAPRVKAEKAKVDQILFKSFDESLKDKQFGGLELTGRVENTSSDECSYAQIVVILFDSNDKPIGVLTDTILDTVAPGEKLGYKATSFSLPDSITSSVVARYEIYAYSYQYQF
ncbi:MAG: FxLYD domain-containing protein [Clostridiales bacterium]|nr:FxLYD domain-containing protein [Clostridiales bacterium]